MNKNRITWLIVILASLAGMVFYAPQAESAALEEISVEFNTSVPQSITYEREFHRSTGFTHTKYYRLTRYGRSYAGYLTFQQKSGDDYGLYKGTLYLQGGNYPVPSKYQPLEQEAL